MEVRHGDRGRGISQSARAADHRTGRDRCTVEPRGAGPAATGVCHSDLHVVDGVGRFPLDRRIVLGHEGAGVVEKIGAEVTTVALGDHVVACLSGFCGGCRQCLSGHPNLCTGGIVTRPDDPVPRRAAAFRHGPDELEEVWENSSPTASVVDNSALDGDPAPRARSRHLPPEHQRSARLPSLLEIRRCRALLAFSYHSAETGTLIRNRWCCV
jgi:hypothetical protein